MEGQSRTNSRAKCLSLIWLLPELCLNKQKKEDKASIKEKNTKVYLLSKASSSFTSFILLFSLALKPEHNNMYPLNGELMIFLKPGINMKSHLIGHLQQPTLPNA